MPRLMGPTRRWLSACCWHCYCTMSTCTRGRGPLRAPVHPTARLGYHSLGPALCTSSRGNQPSAISLDNRRHAHPRTHALLLARTHARTHTHSHTHAASLQTNFTRRPPHLLLSDGDQWDAFLCLFPFLIDLRKQTGTIMAPRLGMTCQCGVQPAPGDLQPTCNMQACR